VGGVPVSEGDIVTVVIGRFEPLLGAGLTNLLGETSRVRVLASEVDDAMLEDVVARHRPRVVIVGETVESDVLACLKTDRAVAGVLVLAHSPSAQCGTVLLANGISCVARSTPVGDLLAAIRSAAAGEPMLVNAARGRVERRRRGEALTPRELEVLEHLRMGRGYAKIGRDLQISPTTVRSHTGNICRKLNVPSKRELIGFALPIGNPD
jgi:DNA-binding NarL/FixJ family response regulator